MDGPPLFEITMALLDVPDPCRLNGHWGVSDFFAANKILSRMVTA
jgi:hypothetical protein